jgi:hypothetical protein
MRARESLLVKREAQDGKRAGALFVCEIRDTLHERRIQEMAL